VVKDKPIGSPAFLKKEIPNNRMRVKEVNLPLSTSTILGDGIDVTALPEGHFSCVHCKNYKFEVSIYGDFHRLEAGCMHCSHAYRFLFPLDCPLPPNVGRFTCFKHKTKGMIIIHNVGKLCVGCESCKTQIIFDIKTKNNLILSGEIN
jgi:hypothetical protein